MARDWMFKAELPAGWAGEIARDYQRRAAKPPSADEIGQEREAVLGRLRQDWGDATDQKLAQIRDLVLRAGDDRLAESLDRSGLGNNEWLVRQLAILADRNAAKAAEKREAGKGTKANRPAMRARLTPIRRTGSAKAKTTRANRAHSSKLATNRAPAHNSPNPRRTARLGRPPPHKSRFPILIFR